MPDSFSRRQFIKGCGAIGAMTVLTSAGCASKRPTRVGQFFPHTANDVIAFTDVFVVDVKKGTVSSDKVVLMKGGKIQGVVNKKDPMAKQKMRINCMGRYLIPGLINAHCHLNMGAVNTKKVSDFGAIREQIHRNYLDCIAWGITTARDLGSMPKIMAKDREKIDRGEIIGPHILTSIGYVATKGGYPEFAESLPAIAKWMIGEPALFGSTPSDARENVLKYIDQGANLIKVAFDHTSILYGREKINTFTKKELDAIVNEAAKHGMPVAAHHMFSEGLDVGLEFGLGSFEHLASNKELTDEQMIKILDKKIPFVPTATTGLNLAFASEGDPYVHDPVYLESAKWRDEKIRPEIPRHAVPRIVELSDESLAYYKNGEYALAKNKKVFSYNPPIFTRAVVIGSRNLAKLIKGGAIVGVGNDSGAPFTYPGMLHFEMEMLVRHGMTNAEALAAATIVNAQICHIEDQCGSIEAGKRADLVLLDANPLEDIRNVAKVNSVYKEGELLAKSGTSSMPV